MSELGDYLKIGLIAFAGVFVINRALRAMNASQYTTSGN